jgi:hypothetical protein
MVALPVVYISGSYQGRITKDLSYFLWSKLAYFFCMYGERERERERERGSFAQLLQNLYEYILGGFLHPKSKVTSKGSWENLAAKI